ncbi:hypothetical protein ACIA5A_29405 [Micromonospora sp. NPDC051300]|uniref:hypothetical protein n=1 Tax=Micromonospora sp. NPDC051300 TaxID=3364286 RepID=UPI00378BBFEB
MSAPHLPGPPPRPGPPPGVRPGPPPGIRPAPVEEVGVASHPAVDAAVRGMANAEALAPADQIAQYEAAYDTLRETLASIDQA